jgi:hypothetical protein
MCNNTSRVITGLQHARLLFALPCLLALLLQADCATESGVGFGARLEAPEADVLQAVREVASDQIIHGTFSYEKEKILYGAHAADSSTVFRDTPAGWSVFYKVAERVLAPRYFKDSGDEGTVTVRYAVRAEGPAAAIIQIDAVFLDARHRPHASQGSVESAEYAAVREHLQAIALKHQQEQEEAADLDRRRKEAKEVAEQKQTAKLDPPAGPLSADSVKDLQLQVAQVRRQVEFRVREGGTPLKSAPFKSASNLELLAARTDVIVVIITPYWYGIETAEGHRGWVQRRQLEALP